MQTQLIALFFIHCVFVLLFGFCFASMEVRQRRGPGGARPLLFEGVFVPVVPQMHQPCIFCVNFVFFFCGQGWQAVFKQTCFSTCFFLTKKQGFFRQKCTFWTLFFGYVFGVLNICIKQKQLPCLWLYIPNDRQERSGRGERGFRGVRTVVPF